MQAQTLQVLPLKTTSQGRIGSCLPLKEEADLFRRHAWPRGLHAMSSSTSTITQNTKTKLRFFPFARWPAGRVVVLLGRHPDRPCGSWPCHSCALACGVADLRRIRNDGCIPAGKPHQVCPSFRLRIRSSGLRGRRDAPWHNVFSERHSVRDRRCRRPSRHLHFAGDFGLADRASEIRVWISNSPKSPPAAPRRRVVREMRTLIAGRSSSRPSEARAGIA